jgi:hypothetical protein
MFQKEHRKALVRKTGYQQDFQTLLFTVFLAFLSAACGGSPFAKSQLENDSTTSAATGIISGSIFSKPKALTTDALKKFASTILKSTKKSAQNELLKTNIGDNTEAFGKLYSEAVLATDGIPREQGVQLVEALVSPTSQSCGGVSCAKVFGVEKDQVEDFMDNLLTEAGQKEGTPQRQQLVASLMPEEAFDKPVKPRDIVASLYRSGPRFLPLRSHRPSGIMLRANFMKLAGLDLVKAVHQYTSVGYSAVRQMEQLSPNEAAKQGISQSKYEFWKRQSVIINENLKKLPVVPSVIYRGIEKVPYEQIASWVKKWQSGIPIHLGPNDLPAITSATWDIQTAKKFLALKSPFNAKKTETMSIFFEIEGHKGVGIEDISYFPEEAEVLIPASDRFQIKEIAPLGIWHRALVIKLQGVRDHGALH